MIDLPAEWLLAASDDIDAAEKLLSEKHLTHIVSFHCQQAVEKTFKAVLEKYGENVEKTHNLEKLFTKVNKYLSIAIDETILLKINEIYIDSRYPADFGLLPDGKPPLQQAEEFVAFAKYIKEQISSLINSSNTF